MTSVLSRIAHTMAVPRRLLPHAVGVDISDTSIKYIAFAPARNRRQFLEVQEWGEVDLPLGSFSRGEVNDVEKFVAALKQVREQCSTPYVRMSLPEERAYIFETEVHRDLSAKEVYGQLEYRLEENVPIPAREAYFDYSIMEDPERPTLLRAVVTVYNRELIDTYYHAAINAGMIPLSFEVEAQAIARATIARSSKRTHLIIDFGKTRSGLGIVRSGALMYTSTIDIGGAELSRNLRKILGDVSEKELTRIKNTEGLIRHPDHPDVYDALLSTMSIIKDEIMLRVEYWRNKEQFVVDDSIDSIILCGGSANMKGLPEYFSEQLDIPTVRARVWQNAFDIDSYIPPIGRRFSYGYASAIGLALTNYIEYV